MFYKLSFFTVVTGLLWSCNDIKTYEDCVLDYLSSASSPPYSLGIRACKSKFSADVSCNVKKEASRDNAKFTIGNVSVLPDGLLSFTISNQSKLDMLALAFTMTAYDKSGTQIGDELNYANLLNQSVGAYSVSEKTIKIIRDSNAYSYSCSINRVMWSDQYIDPFKTEE